MIESMNTYRIVLIAALLSMTSILMGQPAQALPTAQEIAQKIYDRDDGKTAESEMTMSLIPDEGSARERTMKVFSKDFGEKSKRLILFSAPKKIQGTSFLSLEQHDKDDLQFLYLPALRRVRRIAGSQKARSFVNSDFTYEDMERRKVERDSYTLLGSEMIDGRDTWKLERKARDEDDSQYAKSILWVVKDSYVVVKSELYDKKGKLSKHYTAKKLEKVDGIWTALEMSMQDVQRGHTTINKIVSVKYNRPVSDDIFTKAYMERSG